jgi:exodeoxyribonuclease VII large subunit
LEVTILPVSVQGDAAAQQIATALQSISNFEFKPDVVVVTRGGGSPEDLWCFNEEIVCRAIYHCPVPVVCGVGHEIDVTLADFVADVRALTPSDAALRIVPDRNEIRRQLDELKKLLISRLTMKYDQAFRSLESLVDRPVLAQPLARFQNLEMELDRLVGSLDRAIQSQIREQEQSLKQFAGRLAAINPASVLARGYSLTCDEGGRLLFDSQVVDLGAIVKTQLAKGTLISRVEEVGH